MGKILIKRGVQAAIDQLTLSTGEFALAKDTGNLYIGIDSGKVHVNPKGGEASSAEKLSTPRNFSMTGEVTASAQAFDGTQDIVLQAVLANVVGLSAGTYVKVTVDEKGRVISGGTLVVDDIPTGIPSTKIAGLGTAAVVNVGNGNGNVPVIQSDGKLIASIIPDLAGLYIPIGRTVNGKPLSSNIVLNAEDVNAISVTEKGSPGGVATLDGTGKVPATQLPGFVDDVVDCYIVSGSTAFTEGWLSETEDGAALHPESGKIYIVVSAGTYYNKQYRWSGSVYAEISSSLALGETASTAFRGDLGKVAYEHSQITAGNPHGTTAEDVGAVPTEHTNQVASSEKLGHVKAGTAVGVSSDGSLELLVVDGGTF